VDGTRKPALHARAARNNMGVVRFFGFPAMRGFNLQTRPGQYTEQAFVGIDRVIAAAADHGCAPPCGASREAATGCSSHLSCYSTGMKGLQAAVARVVLQVGV